MVNIGLKILGYLMLWSACDIGRDVSSKIILFSSNWWIR